MNVSPFSEFFIPFLKENKLITSKANETNYKLMLFSLFKEILEAEKYIESALITSKVSTKVAETIEMLNLPNSNRYFPKTIRKYIMNTACVLTKYSCQINKRENHVYFYEFDNTKYKKYVKFVFIWLYICIKHADSKCANELNVHIYLTPFKKNLPTNKTTIISTEHVNTAFTYNCLPEGEITIFRAEEWFKVFLHETFHAYNLDFGLSVKSGLMHKSLASLFRIKCDFNINEAYTETWARIINCAMYSYGLLKADKNYSTFELYTEFCLQLERIFSLYQMNKILSFMGLNYTDIYLSEAYLKQSLYKEATHVFGYYILTAIFLNDYKEFIHWCFVNNKSESAIKFKGNTEHFQKMSEYIKINYAKTDLLKTLAVLKYTAIKPKSGLVTSTRMTVIDIADI